MNWIQLTAAGLALSLVQVLAALPWVAALGWYFLFFWRSQPGQTGTLHRILTVLGLVLVLTSIPIALITTTQDPEALEVRGRVYSAVLHLQLCLDIVLIPLAALLWVWPKGGAVALAAFREGIRQPMFWLLTGAAFFCMGVTPILPYYTFGEDFVMVKQLGYDFIMLAALIFGVLAASMSITEEIEGRTAVTLMSKPVSRRQFLVGKYAGILLAGLLMTMLLAWWFNWVLLFKRNDIPLEIVQPPPQPALMTEFLKTYLANSEVADFLRGAFQWFVEAGDVLPGVILCFCQVMVLLAIATALATRLPLVVNLVTCLFVYFLGHLTPILVQISKHRQESDPTSAVSQLLTFMAQLFDTLVPSLDLFRVDSALLSDAPPPLDQFFIHVGMAAGLALLYTIIGLLLGLILFEDRDLA